MQARFSQAVISVLTTSVVLVTPIAIPAAASTFVVTKNTSSSTLNSLVEAILGTTPFTNAKLNGYANGSADVVRAIEGTTGLFTGGSELVGISQGLVLTADANPENLNDDNVTQDIPPVTGVNDPNSPSLPEALFTVADSALGINSAHSISTLEFTIPQRTANFLKLTYSLVISESGEYDEDSGTWDGEVFEFPDGVGIFVKEAGTEWAANQNCAVIPTTSTYVSMETAGIVAPQATVAESRQLAQDNYDDLVAPTLVDGYVPTPTTVSLGTPGTGQIAPPRIAYATDGELGIRDDFITVPLTCVVDVSSFTSVEVGIAIANFNDSAVPPALLIAGGSVGFSGSVAPVSVVSAPEPVAAAPYVGPNSFTKVSALSGGKTTLIGEKLDSVSTMRIEGREVEFTLSKDGTLEFTVPSDLQPGTYDIVLVSSGGQVTLQQHLQITGSAVAKQFFGRKISPTLVKMYYFNPKGPGVVSFRVDGREIARHAIDARGIATGSKLRAKGTDTYMVRSVALLSTRAKILEIFVNGKRVWRATYKAS